MSVFDQMPPRVCALFRRLTAELPGPITELSLDDYDFVLASMPATIRFTNPAETRRPTLLFAGHWITPK